MSIPMIGDYKFEPQGDSPVDLSGREGYEPSCCPGLDDSECGDEIPDDARLCPSCQRQADRAEELEAWTEDGCEPLVSYPHLTDNEEHLR